MSAFTDRELDDIDAAAIREQRRAHYLATNTRPADLFNGILAQHAAVAVIGSTLAAQELKANARRFSGASVTGHGELA